MPKDSQDVYMEVYFMPDKQGLLNLEKKYVCREDWKAASVVMDALISEARTRDEFIEYCNRNEKYWETYMKQKLNGGGSIENKIKRRSFNYGS